MKLSNEELSLLLGEHSIKKMARTGRYLDESTGSQCILQVVGKYWADEPYRATYDRVAGWFDRNYSKKWTPDEFLKKLETECP